MHYVALTVITLYLCVRPFLLYADGDTDGHYQKQDLKEHGRRLSHYDSELNGLERSITTDSNPQRLNLKKT